MDAIPPARSAAAAASGQAVLPPPVVWGRFLAWVPVGAAWGLAVVGAMSIGILVAPVAALLTIGLLRWDRDRRGVWGLLAGAGLPFLYVAYLNRGGPGWSCTQDGDTISCTDQFSPWPWLAIAVALVGAGVVLAVRSRRRIRSS